MTVLTKKVNLFGHDHIPNEFLMSIFKLERQAGFSFIRT